jgi:hypothetical protein
MSAPRDPRRSRAITCALLGLFTGLLACSGEGGDAQTASTVEPPRTADLSYQPEITDPAYATGQGPAVCVDETHNNFHTSVGTYMPFARVLRADGYRVTRFNEPGPRALEGCRVLVIADAQPPARAEDPPTFPADEVERLDRWVRGGGSLLLITDHLPDPGAIEALAGAFGIEVHNGYVLNGPPQGPGGAMVFRLDDGTLSDDPLLRGRGPGDEVTRVATFLGSALRGGESFRPLLVFGPGRLSWAPTEYYRFEDDTPRIDVEGWSQGGVLEHGAGRLAVFGEAAMFTAQIFDQGRTRVGMNAPEAPDNLRLLRNVMHWLTRVP